MTYKQKLCPLCGRDMTAIETHLGRGELYCGHCDLTIGGNDAKTPEELIALMDGSEHRRLEAENAKLKELVWDLYCLAYPSAVEWEVSDETYDKYSPCEKCHELHGGKSPCASTTKDMTEECCAPIQANVVADRMRELGVMDE